MKSPPKKTCILEPMPTSSVIAWIEVLPPVLTKIINFSFESGMFADNWKCTLFNPLSKIPGLDLVLFRLKNWIVTTLQGLISIGYSYLSPNPAVSGARHLYWTCSICSKTKGKRPCRLMIRLLSSEKNTFFHALSFRRNSQQGAFFSVLLFNITVLFV